MTHFKTIDKFHQAPILVHFCHGKRCDPPLCTSHDPNSRVNQNRFIWCMMMRSSMNGIILVKSDDKYMNRINEPTTIKRTSKDYFLYYENVHYYILVVLYKYIKNQ